jgi:hypothetical protein
MLPAPMNPILRCFKRFGRIYGLFKERSSVTKMLTRFAGQCPTLSANVQQISIRIASQEIDPLPKGSLDRHELLADPENRGADSDECGAFENSRFEI